MTRFFQDPLNQTIKYTAENAQVDTHISKMNIFRVIENKTNETCPICMEIYNCNSKVVVLSCGHVFDRDCIVQWNLRMTNCPLCRKLS